METQYNEDEIKGISDQIDQGIVDDSFYTLLPSVIGQVIDKCETTDSQIYKTIIHGLLRLIPLEKESSEIIVDWEMQYKKLLEEMSNLQKKYEDLEEVHQRESNELEKRRFVAEWESHDKRLEKALSRRKEKIKKDTPDIYDLIQDKKIGPQIQKVFVDTVQAEHFDFFIDYKKFIEIEDKKIRESEAKRMYEKYIKDHAPEEINIPFCMKAEIEAAIYNNIFTRSLFSDAARELDKIFMSDTIYRMNAKEIKKRGINKFVSFTGTICNVKSLIE